jgi:ABC-type antimicrobial peptide transport system permease subunit
VDAEEKRADGSEAPTYRTATIQRGSVKSTVSATGTLGAVETIQVGTQASGQVAAIYVDYNGHVRKGQLLARIDPRLQSQAVEDAQAQLERAQATLEHAESDWARGKQLFDANAITASELSTVQSNVSVQRANVKSARIALERARQNLAYTNIHAPIDGVIVERNVDVGQTVAANFSAPQLFLIANDLSHMQILVSVDESDIGAIRTLRNQTQVTQAITSTTRTMSALLAAIASISLLVGGIGIMNITLVSVTERTREIGIRMAMGARARDILNQFLVESIAMSVMGGLVGLAVGYAGATLLGRVAGWPVATPPSAVLIAVGFSAAVGVFFGLYPARKAAALNPIEALRYE